MKRIVLFRYHNQFEMCLNRIKLIEHFNPGIEFFGFYGGDAEDFQEAEIFFKDIFVHNYCLKNDDAFLRWKNCDLGFRDWYIDVGCHYTFDMVHMMEWDLLQFGSFDKIYAEVKEDQLGITGLIPISEIETEWFWARNEEQRKGLLKLKEFLKQKYDFDGEVYGSLGPGLCFSRKFIERYSIEEIPDYTHDEIRIPTFAEVFGFTCVSTGFYREWFSKKEWKYFNSNNLEIKERRIKRQLRKKDGRRVFHPYRKILNIEFLKLNGIN